MNTPLKKKGKLATNELTKVPIGSIYDSIDELNNKKNDTGVPNYLRWFRWTGYFWNSLDMSKYGTQIKKIGNQ